MRGCPIRNEALDNKLAILMLQLDPYDAFAGSRMRIFCLEAASQSFTVLSMLPEASNLPSVEKATLVI